MMQIEMPWPPSVNRYWRSVRGRNILSAEGRAYRESLPVIAAKMHGPILCVIEAFPPDRRRRDLDNMLKALLDGLQHAGAYADDSQIDDLRIVRRKPVAGGKMLVNLEELR